MALYGGNSPTAILNSTGKPVDQIVKDMIWDSKKEACTLSYCTKPPVVTCSPGTTVKAGDLVKCTIEYHYAPIAPVIDGLEGLNGVYSQPLRISATYVAETGKGG